MLCFERKYFYQGPSLSVLNFQGVLHGKVLVPVAFQVVSQKKQIHLGCLKKKQLPPDKVDFVGR